jgi:hypothetical protein
MLHPSAQSNSITNLSVSHLSRTTPPHYSTPHVSTQSKATSFCHLSYVHLHACGGWRVHGAFCVVMMGWGYACCGVWRMRRTVSISNTQVNTTHTLNFTGLSLLVLRDVKHASRATMASVPPVSLVCTHLQILLLGRLVVCSRMVLRWTSGRLCTALAQHGPIQHGPIQRRGVLLWVDNAVTDRTCGLAGGLLAADRPADHCPNSLAGTCCSPLVRPGTSNTFC